MAASLLNGFYNFPLITRISDPYSIRSALLSRSAQEVVCVVLVLLGSLFAPTGALIAMHPDSLETPDVKEANRLACIGEMKAEYEKILSPIVDGKHAVLVDMVTHGNLGDSFIQYGEHLFLANSGNFPRIHCSVVKCDWDAVNQSLVRHQPSVMLIHGGGNFGDIWNTMRIFHQNIVSNFSHVPIVFLPQSVHYSSLEKAEEDAQIFAAHPNIRYFVRDAHSLRFLRTHFKEHPSELCPDAAFVIPPFKVSECKPRYDVILISRQDSEKGEDFSVVSQAVKQLKRHGISYFLTDWPRTIPKKVDRNIFSLQRPEILTEFGRKHLCKGRLVVTDRLHAVLMSTLIGLPHIYVDNHYGKITRFRSTFFKGRHSCKNEYLRARRAKTWTMAIKLAIQRLESS